MRMLRAAMPNAPMTTPRVLSIAGSDSGGGAGIQADLKAFASCGVHGMTAITAVTWQNTVAVTGITPIPPEAILGQVRAVADDIGVDAVKIGMLGSAETVDSGAGGARPARGRAGGARSGDGRRKRRVAARPRCASCAGGPPARGHRHHAQPAGGPRARRARRGPAVGETPAELAAALGALGPGYVVVTGGHVDGAEVVDLFWDGEHAVDIPGPRYPGGSAHGSGCTHSSALAAHLALGLDPLEAAVAAKRVASEAVRDALTDIGAGPGPVDALGIAARRRITDSAAL